MKEKGYLRISDLVKVSGVPRSTIHFYLRQGILHPPLKTGRTMAYYDESHLERLVVIKKMKRDLRMPTAFLKSKLDEMEKSPQSIMTAPLEEMEPSTSAPGHKNNKRQNIIAAAIQVFSKKGYHHTKVQDITGGAGISTGTFYLYFTNKSELFIEVVDDIIRNIIGDAARAIKEEKDLEKRLILRGRTFHANYSKYREILNQLRAEMSGEDNWPKEKVKIIYQDLTAPVIREAKQAIEQGQIRPLDPELFAYALTGLIEILSFRMTLDHKYSFEDILSFLREIFLNGILPPAGTAG